MSRSQIAVHGVIRPSSSVPGSDGVLVTDAVTFLFTDIEGSTALWEQDGARMSRALAAHDAVARSLVEARHGKVVKTTGDGIHAVFDNALDALAATVALQQALADTATTDGVPLRVRCGLHAGVVERRDNDYFGSPVNRAARIMGAAHGSQMLLSQAVADVVRGHLTLRDLGNVRLKDLSTPEHVYQVVHPDLRQEFPALRSLEATPNNLPQQATSFVGREKELTALKRLLAANRLLTLTGAGGSGKTRLGLQVAADSLERFPDGVWFVELASLADPDLVPQTVATVLGLKEASGKTIAQTLTQFLEDKRLLLLLDNCEHLLDSCAKLADALVRHCPHVTVLASSREALGISGEQGYRVPSLSLPDPKQAHTPASVAPFEAVQLFADRALLARPDFAVTAQNAPALASICYRLDGIPLAIELAAARVRALSVEEINRNLDQRFRLLTGGSRTALPRQQTLRSLIDWSYDLLNAPERLLLQRLSVFAGGWTLQEAEQVCAEGDAGEVLDLLTSLTDKSLCLMDQHDGNSRYRLLETVRQYAREKLLESGCGEAVRERHLDCFLALADEAEPKLRGAEQASWLRRLDEEYDNLRSALDWSCAGVSSRRGLRLCGALQRFWWARGYLSEGRDWCARFLGKTGAEDRTQEHAKALHVAGVLAYHQGDYPSARTLDEESLVIRRQLGDQKGIARLLGNLGNVVMNQRDFATARTLHEQSLAIKRELGHRQRISSSLNSLATLFAEQGDFAAARTLYQEGLTIGRELGDRLGIAISLRGLAAVVAAIGNWQCAARIWGAAEQLRAEVGSPLSPNDRSHYDQKVAAARAALDDDAAFDRAWRDGRALKLEQATELALQESVKRT